MPLVYNHIIARQEYEPLIKRSSNTDNLSYDLYSFTAVYTQTKRIHKNKIIEVPLKDNPIELIRLAGYENPISFTKIQFERPSLKQAEFYFDLTGKQLPNNASKKDATALIGRYLDDDIFFEKDLHSPNPDLVMYAIDKRFKFSFYIGKKRLYEMIFDGLDLIDKIIFYTFCVYKDYLNKKGIKINGNPNQSPNNDLFHSFADAQSVNKKYVKSLLRTNGYKLRYFGDYELPDGAVICGCNQDTIAYKTTIDFLKEMNIV